MDYMDYWSLSAVLTDIACAKALQEVQTSKTFEMLMVIILIFEGLSYYTARDESGLHVQCRDNLRGKRTQKLLCPHCGAGKTNPLNLYRDWGRDKKQGLSFILSITSRICVNTVWNVLVRSPQTVWHTMANQVRSKTGVSGNWEKPSRKLPTKTEKAGCIKAVSPTVLICVVINRKPSAKTLEIHVLFLDAVKRKREMHDYRGTGYNV